MSDAGAAPPATPATGTAPAAPPHRHLPADPMELLKSKSYVQLLVLAALIGVPVSAVAYFYLALVSKLQPWIYQSLPKALGFQGTPAWWPVPILLIAGVLVAATITYLPGHVRARTGQRLPGRRWRPDAPPSCRAWSSPRSPRWPSVSCSAPRRR